MFVTHGSLINEIGESQCGYDSFNFNNNTYVLCDGANSCKNGGVLARLLSESIVHKWPSIVEDDLNRAELIYSVIFKEHTKYLTENLEAASTLVGLKTITYGFEMISIGDSYGEVLYKDQMQDWKKIYSMPRDLDNIGRPWQLIGSEVLEQVNYKKFDQPGSYCIFLLSDGAGNFLTEKNYFRATELIGDKKPNSDDLNFLSSDMVGAAKRNKSIDDISVAILFINF